MLPDPPDDVATNAAVLLGTDTREVLRTNSRKKCDGVSILPLLRPPRHGMEICNTDAEILR